MFKGVIPALVTPFAKDGSLNEGKIRELIRFHLDKGTSGIVAAGTTGESPTLSKAEKIRLYEVCLDETAGRIPIIAGTGGNNTAAAIELTNTAKSLGADGVLIVAPYYNKPTQEGIYRHFMTIADIGVPVVVYNVPGRTAVNIEAATIERLSVHEKIVAVKEAAGNLAQASEIHRRCGDKLVLLSGDDPLTLPILSVGGVGTISVTGNIVPDQIQAMIDAYLQGDHIGALKIHHGLELLHNAMFFETNPIPLKTAMNMMGMDVGGFRLPLCEMSEANTVRLKAVLTTYELIPR